MIQITSCMCGDLTFMCGDLTLMCGDLTFMCGDLTLMCGDLTFMCGDLTFKENNEVLLHCIKNVKNFILAVRLLLASKEL